MASTSGTDDSKFEDFMKEVKVIEKRDEIYTSDQQIERLTKPGSKYLNLNPYEVLMIDPTTPIDQAKKQYRKLSILVHPDKNHDKQELAQRAMDAVSVAYKLLENEEEVKKVKLILEEAEALINEKLKEKRREAKRISPTATIPEDTNAEIFCKFRRAITCKLFADNEIKRQELVERSQSEKKRQAEQEHEEQDKAKRHKEMEKKWDETRTARVDDWRSFQTKADKKAKRTKTFKVFKPPKPKAESR